MKYINFVHRVNTLAGSDIKTQENFQKKLRLCLKKLSNIMNRYENFGGCKNYVGMKIVWQISRPPVNGASLEGLLKRQIREFVKMGSCQMAALKIIFTNFSLIPCKLAKTARQSGVF